MTASTAAATAAATPAASRAPARYTRLPGRVRGLIGSASLWLAVDHLLLVQSRGYVEVYRRFYFEDIQSLLVRRTSRALYWTLGLLLPLLSTAAAAVLDSGAGRIAWSVAAGALALALLVHLLRGATCVCQVQTAVETTVLPALRRLRPALRTCEQVRARVEAVQGRPGADELARGAPTTWPAARREPAPLPLLEPANALSPTRPGTLRWHTAFFALLLADTAVSTGQVASGGQALHALALLVAIAEFLVGIAALVESRRRRLDPRLKRPAALGLVYVCASFVAGWATTVIGSVQAAIAQRPAPALAGEWIAMASIPLTALLGVWGFLVLRRLRSSS